MKIVIDPGAGFCPGVKKAIRLAEEHLSGSTPVKALGSLIHNPAEIKRLEDKGLKTIEIDDLEESKYNSSGEKILIRAHGEPPETYRILQEQNLSVIDGTCPIVRRSQLLARSYFEKGYLVILVGKKGHPEIIGINGYCENKTLVIETPEEVDTIPSGKKLFVMAQTTAHPETHTKIIEKIRKKGHAFESKNTICKYIINREAEFVEFIRECDIVLVVGGKNSSNTGVLYKNALREQKQTYRIEKPEELDFNWFKFQDTVGITGGTSTPPRLIEQVKKILEVKFNSSVSSVKRPIRS